MAATVAPGAPPRRSNSAPRRRAAALDLACATITPCPGTSATIPATYDVQEAPALPTSRVRGSTATIDQVACAGAASARTSAHTPLVNA